MRRRAAAFAIMVVALAACAPSQRQGGAWGPYPDRAARNQAMQRLSPHEQATLGAAAASSPEAVNALRELPVEEQKQLYEQYRNATPEAREEMEKQAESFGR